MTLKSTTAKQANPLTAHGEEPEETNNPATDSPKPKTYKAQPTAL